MKILQLIITLKHDLTDQEWITTLSNWNKATGGLLATEPVNLQKDKTLPANKHIVFFEVFDDGTISVMHAMAMSVIMVFIATCVEDLDDLIIEEFTEESRVFLAIREWVKQNKRRNHEEF